MKRGADLIVLAAALAVCIPGGLSQGADGMVAGNIQAQVCFTPGGGCIESIVKMIASARSEILIQAYAFHSPPLIRTLIEAHGRGVKILILLDKSERMEGLTPAALLAGAGIPVFLDGKHAVANNRVIIIDGRIVMTGSLNFNRASEEMNAENLLILESGELAAQYRDNWLLHRGHSEPY